MSSSDEFYLKVAKESKSDKNQAFWMEYFEFLNAILNTVISDDSIVDCVKKLWDKDCEFNKSDKSDPDKSFICIMYIYYYSKHHNEYVTPLQIEKLKYVLDNLRYQDCNHQNFSYIRLFAEKSSIFEDVIQYFHNKNDKEIIQELNLNIAEYYSSLGVNDIKVRIKEQSIKVKIIDMLKNDLVHEDSGYNFFKKLEIQSKKRQIYYLLFISDLWDNEIRIDKIYLLLEYMKISYIFMCNSDKDLLWRKLFAISTHYDSENNILLNSETINTNSSNNFHIWCDDLYYNSDDSNEDKTSDSMKGNIKKSYDICHSYNLTIIASWNIWIKKQFNESYNTCWLQYAIDRDFSSLLSTHISYTKNGSILIEIAKEPNGYQLSEKANFFAYVYLLDKHKCGWTSEYACGIRDYKSKLVRDFTSINGVRFNHKANVIAT